MTLHIFNPEHDIALASGLACFTAPHAGRQLRHDLGWLPLLWAGQDDRVLTDSPEAALTAWARLCGRLGRQADEARLLLTPWRDSHPLQADAVEPWGWDAALCAALQRRADGLPLPAAPQLDAIRQLSHRRTAAQLLPQLRRHGTVGQAWPCGTPAEVDARRHDVDGDVVMKAPWSSSGRGLRFAKHRQPLLPNVEAWMANVMRQQGCVMVEPYYDKVKDFGMEFTVGKDGHVEYEGLSLFSTKNGAYTGNLLATETHKRRLLCRYLPAALLDEVARSIAQHMEQLLRQGGAVPWVTAFGVDMMVVAAPQGDIFLLHPCVEVNLRRTMGHAALAMTRLLNPAADDDVVRVMRIVWEDNQYKLKIERL